MSAQSGRRRRSAPEREDRRGGRSGTHFSTRGTYMRVFVLIGICCVVAFFLALLIRRGVRAAAGTRAAVLASEA
ncbi:MULTISPECIES: hypothetical protein [unclassified Streptomyces]|uniref:hypothetical protein n=1 Tax=unclassified Streptomyces TaxID=2593676 RepID=UPI00114C97AE|nr:MULTISPECIES: hypothetical protein [unclassified Streptomyces]MYZ34738.1 hypothetical protein [Streptomyces sp. SID4917]